MITDSLVRASSYPSVDALTEAMSAGDTTNKWDIVCSYSLKKLNDLLLDSYNDNNSKIVKKIPTFTTTYKIPFIKQSYDICYDLTLGAPEMHFVAGLNSMCMLSMTVSGQYTATPSSGGESSTTIIPDKTYTLQCQVPLKALKGDTAETYDAGTIINFDPAGNDSSHIVLHFATTDTDDWKVSPATDDIICNASAGIATYFKTHITEIEYALTSVNNNKPACVNGSETIIDPKSFTFVTAGDADTAALSIYIQTTNSGNDPGGYPPAFQPGGMPTLPVPLQHEASLIFSRDFIQKVYLLPGLKAQNFIKTYASDGPIDPKDINHHGCHVEGCSPFIKSFDKQTIYPATWETLKFDGCTIDYTNAPFSFNFLKNNLTINMSYSLTQSWDWTKSDPESPYSVGHSGKATATIKYNGSFNLSDPTIVNVTDQNMVLNINLTPSLDITFDGGGDCGGDYILKKVKSFINSEISGAIPTFKFSLGSLNYFKETNLLFPGQKILKFDSTFNMNMPCDMILLANFV